MGSIFGKDYGNATPSTLKNNEYCLALDHCINKRNFNKMFQYLDYFKDSDIDIAYIHELFLYRLVNKLASIDDTKKYKILRKVLREYSFDLNKEISPGEYFGNTLYHSILGSIYDGVPCDIKLYQILVDCGSNINYVGHLGGRKGTILNRIGKEITKEKFSDLANFLIKNDASVLSYIRNTKCGKCGTPIKLSNEEFI